MASMVLLASNVRARNISTTSYHFLAVLGKPYLSAVAFWGANDCDLCLYLDAHRYLDSSFQLRVLLFGDFCEGAAPRSVDDVFLKLGMIFKTAPVCVSSLRAIYGSVRSVTLWCRSE
jgi:hypothetical protein